MSSPSHEEQIQMMGYLLKTFSNSSELWNWLRLYVWPRFQARKRSNRARPSADGAMTSVIAHNVLEADKEQTLLSQSCPHQELIDFWLSVFATSDELHNWLVDYVWPRFKAAGRKGAVKLDTTWSDLDGTALSERETTRRYKQQLPMRHITTGKTMVHDGRVWQEVK